MKNEIITDDVVKELYNNIKFLVETSRNKVYKTVNIEMINLYWNIGKMIVDKQKGTKRAKYGDYLIEKISIKLTDNFGKGFSTRNLKKNEKIIFILSKKDNKVVPIELVSLFGVNKNKR